MADQAQKKAKQRLKREKNQRAVRKTSSLTPLHYLSQGSGKLECWMTRGWEKEGLANVIVIGTAPDGRNAVGVFLVDVWCVGLKDAFVYPNVPREQWQPMLERAMAGSPMTSVKLDKVRSMVAGAVRFSRQAGFKLPRQWEKAVKILGSGLNFADADISGFGKDGGLFYVGTERYLRTHLIGTTVAEFAARPDVEVLIQGGSGMLMGEDGSRFDDEDNAYDLDDDEEDDESDAFDDLDVDELANQIAPELALKVEEATLAAIAKVEQEFVRKNIAQPARLHEAVQYISALAFSESAMRALGGMSPDAGMMYEALDNLMASNGERDPDGLKETIGEIYEVMGADISNMGMHFVQSLPPAV